jgi:hypothetical protein
MEVRLTIFLALVSVVLIWNTVLLWALFKGLSRSAEKATRLEGPSEKLLRVLRSTVLHAESVSAKATDYSSKAREKAVDLGGDFDRAQNWFRFGLAKMDFEMNRVSEGVRDATVRAKEAAEEPLSRAGAVVHGVKAVLELIQLPMGDDSPAHSKVSPPR